MADLMKAIAKTAVRPIFNAIENRIIYPWAAWRGWRPSSLRPVRLEDLKWTLGYEDEAAIKAAIGIVAPYTLVTLDSLASLWWQIRYLDRAKIPGALVECGVRMGGSAAMMALAHMASDKPYRALHLFDSFTQMPDPTEVDGTKAIADAKAADGWRDWHYPEQVSRELIIGQVGYPEALVNQHVGWFNDTLPKDAASVGSVALLRLDGDWYDSTKVCLDYLYDSVSEGGLVVVDDYDYYEGCHRAIDEFLAKLPRIMLHRVDSTCVYWVKA